MNTPLRILLILCLLITGLSVSPSQAARAESMLTTDSSLAMSPKLPFPGTTVYKTLTGLDFHPNTSSITYTSTNGGIYPTHNVPGFGFTAPLNLPSGAAVTEVTVFFVDNSAASNIVISLHGYNPDTDAYTYNLKVDTAWASSSTAVQSKSYTGSPLFTVNNSAAAYQMQVEFAAENGAQVFYGARIKYTTPSPAPTGDDYITLAGTDFQTTSSMLTYTSSRQHLYATKLDNTFGFVSRFVAHLDLPQGAQIKQVDYYVVYNDTELDIFLKLVSRNPAAGMYDLKSTSTFGLAPGTNVQKVTLTFTPSIKIDNSQNSYYLEIQPSFASENLQVVAARVRFTQPAQNLYPRVKTFSGIEFFPTGSGLTFRASDSSETASRDSVYPLTVEAGQSFQVNPDLPQGTVVRKISFYVIDNHLGANLSLAARLYIPKTGQVISPDPVSGTTADLAASQDIREVTFSNLMDQVGTMDALNEGFNLLVEPGAPGPDLMLTGVKVEYSYPGMAFLPVIGK